MPTKTSGVMWSEWVDFEALSVFSHTHVGLERYDKMPDRLNWYFYIYDENMPGFSNPNAFKR